MSYIGNTTANQNYVPAVDYFNGDGSTVAFTLSRPVASVAAVQAVISNVPQNPGSAFTINGNTITFTSAPPTGTNNIYVYYTSPNTSVATLPQSPVITGDVTSTGGQYTIGAFNSGYTDGLVQDYVTGYGRLTVGAADGLKIRNGGPSSPTDLVTVNSVGNVAVGGTLSAWGSTLRPVIEMGSGCAFIGPVGTTSLGVGQNTYYDGSQWIYKTSSQASVYFQAGGTHQWFTSASGTAGGTVSLVQAMTLDNTGNLLVGTTGTAAYLDGRINCVGVSGSPSAGFKSLGNAPQSTVFIWNAADSGTRALIGFVSNSSPSVVGTITSNGTNVAYNTSSDYRLKENIQPMQNALDVVQQLNPVTYTWKADGSDGQGFIAHELQAVVPDCVTGEKDAVDEDGKPVYQGIDTSFLVATLTKAIQELKAEVDDLKAQLEAK